MALYQFSRTSNQLTINGYTDVNPNNYTVQADTLNNIVLISADAGDYKLQINLNSDIVEINGTPFVGNAAALKTELYVSVFNATAGGPKVYRAFLAQTGTDAPVPTILENTLGYVPVWTYSGVGRYVLTLTNTNYLKVFIPCPYQDDIQESNVGYRISNEGDDGFGNTIIQLQQCDLTGGNAVEFDGFSNNITQGPQFQILVYP